MILRYYGARHITEAISEDITLAKYLGDRIEASQDFELLAPVELSICCFRYLPPASRKILREATVEERDKLNVALNAFNEKLMNPVQRGGRAYVSSAVLGGSFALRVCIVNFRTTREDLDATLDILREDAATIEF
jgi:glutamate/tyrosine decarboxylase-like PLP-dependent enzyme